MKPEFTGLVEFAKAAERDYITRLDIYKILEETLEMYGHPNDNDGGIGVSDIPLKPGWKINIIKYTEEKPHINLCNRAGTTLMEPIELTLWFPNGEGVLPKDASHRTLCAVTDNAQLTLAVAENGVINADTREELFGEKLEALLRDVQTLFADPEHFKARQN